MAVSESLGRKIRQNGEQSVGVSKNKCILTLSKDPLDWGSGDYVVFPELNELHVVIALSEATHATAGMFQPSA